jgi:hypothetical protein
MATTTSASNLLVNNTTYLNTTKSNKFYSSKIHNYIESIEISGFRKTVFYSEISTNFNVGDRVFILNGNYDSNDFISKDKYTKYTDGYRVLGVDGCRIILDLDYTDTLPYENENLDDFINIHHIRTQREFDYINSIKVGLTASSPYFTIGGLYSKFFGTISGLTASLYTNNIIYTDDVLSGSSFIENQNGGVSSAGFFVRDDTSSPPNFVNITSNLLSNSIENINNQYTNIGKIYIIGEDIIWNGKTYKQRNVYKYLNGDWVLDTKYKQPIISRLNFRYGKFKGKHNDGIFGTNIKTNNWKLGNWNSGFFINSNWNGGIMNTKLPVDKFYSSTFIGTQSAPVQNLDISNNKGFGYNFILDSNIYSGNIKDGNFENCNIGITSTFSAVDIYYGLTHSRSLSFGGGQLKLCDINSVSFSKSLFVNSEIRNSNISESKFVNSQVIDSTAYKSDFSAKNGIKILAADLWSYDAITINSHSYGTSSVDTTNMRGILKLYISNDDLNKLNLTDSFFISKLNKDYFLSSLNEDQKVLLPIEAKYVLDYYFNYELSSNKIMVSFKNKKDNKWKTQVVCNVYPSPSSYQNSNVLTQNQYDFASIDVQIDNLAHYYDIGIGSLSSWTSTNTPLYLNTYSSFLYPITKDNVNNIFQNTYLQNADFKSGVFEKSNWTSGDNINNYHNIIYRPSLSSSNLKISYTSASTLKVDLIKSTYMNSNYLTEGEDIIVGDNVWLNSIYYNYGLTSISLDGRYKVSATSSSLLSDSFELKPIDTFLLSSLSTLLVGVTYSTNGADFNNYVSLSKMLINNSKINSGLFRRSNIQNSTVVNSLFDNNDKILSISNVDKLRLINILFSNNKNTVKNGLIYKSHFLNGTWENGIVFNSIWNGGTFNNGIFKNGYWLDGTFNNGNFIESNAITYSIPGDLSIYDTDYNYRHWSNGTFSLGEFYNSVWVNGRFNNGRFYNSTWYGGIWNNGVLGSDKIPTINTTMGYKSPLVVGATYTIWNNGIVDNAVIGGSGSVYWYGGKFNNGEFTSSGFVTNNESIWYNGDFNGGKFTELARWKDGNFNKGKFLSHYGWQNVSPLSPSTYSTDYGWENGRFNGGIFGNANTATNSVWFNGEFNDGTFNGRFWNNGIFSKGSFIGSGLVSLGADAYVQSFSQSYYGIWYNGHVSDRKNLIQLDKRISTKLIRKIEEKPILNDILISNILWMSGTFSHINGKLYNSVWLDGTFAKGYLITTQFNPYVDRTFSGTNSYSFNFNDTCVWEGGNFINGNFYVSEWKNGIFYGGAMNGGIWRNGTWNYGNANNVYWENGTWRNGIWNGSPFVSVPQSGTPSLIDSTTYQVNPGYEHDLMINVAQASSDNSLHLINAFGSTTSVEYLTDPNFNNGVDVSLVTTKSLYYTPTSAVDWLGASGYSNWKQNETGFFVTGGIATLTSDNNVYIIATTSTPEDLYLTVDSTKFGVTGSTTSVLQRLDVTYGAIWISSFDRDIYYDVSIDFCAEYGQVSRGGAIDSAIIKIFYGSKSYTIDSLSTTTRAESERLGGSTTYHYDCGFKTVNFSISEKDLILSHNRTIKIKKYPKSGFNSPIVRVLKASIKARVSVYSTVNNTLYPAMPINPTFSSLISVTSSLQLSAISGGYRVPLTFGNGLFKAGVWENGVWNNGWRKDDYVSPFVFTSAIPMIDGNTWNITLHSLGNLTAISQTLQSFVVGDKVSIGNIISIDKNNNRKLLKNYYRIISKDLNSITCQVIVNFPIINIEVDSTKHINYVTKNIWLSGVFLNGYFTGVWNNGLVKGRPYLTFLENTQWIDGEFSGGHFKGLTGSILYDTLSVLIAEVGTEKLGRQDIGNYIETKFDNNGSVINYNQSLIQNFSFDNVYDVNSGTGSDARYDSWIDLNYSTQSQTNLNKNSITYKSRPTGTFSAEYFVNDYNLYGSPTYDILSSYSTLTDYDSAKQQTYKLGSKFTKNYNFLPDNGNFNKPISDTTPFITTYNFDNDGWTLYDSGPKIGYDSNRDSTSIQSIRFHSIATGSFGFINNTNVKDLIEKDRYYLMSANIVQNIGGSNIYFTPLPSTFSTTGSRYFNHKNTNNSEKIEYFYNKQDLELIIWATSSNTNITFGNISFYEVDMIPFFQFTDPNNVNPVIMAPYYVTSVPEIDYNNSNYNFIDNVDIVITLTEIEYQSFKYPRDVAVAYEDIVSLRPGASVGSSLGSGVSVASGASVGSGILPGRISGG